MQSGDRDLDARTGVPTASPHGSAPAGYASPAVTRLGTLADLTLGGAIALDDGVGGAGDDGSL